MTATTAPDTTTTPSPDPKSRSGTLAKRLRWDTEADWSDVAEGRRAANRDRDGWTLARTLDASRRFLRAVQGHVGDGTLPDDEELALVAEIHARAGRLLDEAVAERLRSGDELRLLEGLTGISRSTL